MTFVYSTHIEHIYRLCVHVQEGESDFLAWSVANGRTGKSALWPNQASLKVYITLHQSEREHVLRPLGRINRLERLKKAF